MCDTIAIVQPHRVLFAKNSDRDANEGQGLEWHPRKTHPAAERLRCTWMEIPQARETHAILISRPFWMWGAEIGTNEYGVTIGNEAVFTKQPYAETGLTGMDLLRLALERCTTARAACELIGALLEAHGQGGGCGHENRRFTYHNSFIIADTRGAFVLETAGRLWTMEPVNGARSISNGLTIQPFAEEHGDWLKTRVSACNARRTRTERLAEKVLRPEDLFAVLRDHGNDRTAPDYAWINGGMAAPCMHAGGLVANSHTTASWVAELSPGNNRHWATATSTPCLSLFKPVDPLHPLDLAVPSDHADSSLWWQHERLQRTVSKAPQALAGSLQAERDEIEAAWIAAPPDPETAFEEHRTRLDRWLATLAQVAVQDSRPPWARRYWRLRSQRAGLPPPA